MEAGKLLDESEKTPNGEESVLLGVGKGLLEGIRGKRIRGRG